MNIRGKKFQLDRPEGKIMGVCSGLENLTGLDATIIRIALVVATIAGGYPWTIIAYFVAAWMGKPRKLASDDLARRPSLSSREAVRERTRDLDLRLQAIETYVTSSNSRLAREIEELR